MRVLREGVQATPPHEGPLSRTHWRAALPLCVVREDLLPVHYPQGPRKDALSQIPVRMRTVRSKLQVPLGVRQAQGAEPQGSATIRLPVLRQMRAQQREPEAARPQTHRRTALCLPVLRKGVRGEERPDQASAHPHWRTALPLRHVRKVLRQGRLSFQASHHTHQYSTLKAS
nr:unnamed protein product [Callosobruchus chinensis]